MNDKAEWFTEGYIGEAEIDLATPDKCTLTIDPVAPFKVEYQEEKFVLLVASELLNRPGNGGDEYSAKLVKQSHTFFLDAMGGHGITALTLVKIKASHQKIRFWISEKNSRIVKITLI